MAPSPLPSHQLHSPRLVGTRPLQDGLLQRHSGGLQLGCTEIKQVLGHDELDDLAAQIGVACEGGREGGGAATALGISDFPYNDALEVHSLNHSGVLRVHHF